MNPNSQQQQIQTSEDAGMTPTQTDGCRNKIKAIVLPTVTGLNQPPGLKRRHGSGYWCQDVQILRTLSTDGKSAVMFLEAGGWWLKRLQIKNESGNNKLYQWVETPDMKDSAGQGNYGL